MAGTDFQYSLNYIKCIISWGTLGDWWWWKKAENIGENGQNAELFCTWWISSISIYMERKVTWKHRTFCCASRHCLHPDHTAEEKKHGEFWPEWSISLLFTSSWLEFSLIPTWHQRRLGNVVCFVHRKNRIYIWMIGQQFVFHGYLLWSRFHSSTVLIIISLLYFETKEKWWPCFSSQFLYISQFKNKVHTEGRKVPDLNKLNDTHLHLAMCLQNHWTHFSYSVLIINL